MSERVIEYDETGEIVSADTIPAPKEVKYACAYDDTLHGGALGHERNILHILDDTRAQRVGCHDNYPGFVIYTFRNSWYHTCAQVSLGFNTEWCKVPTEPEFSPPGEQQYYLAVKWLQVGQ